MITLGINAAFHDCAATLVRDGVVLAAVEEERFTQVKHGKRPLPFTAWQLPYHAIDYCLGVAGLHLSEVDRFAYAFDPYLLGEPPAASVAAPHAMAGRGAAASAFAPRLPETIALPLEPSRAARAEGDRSPWDPLFLSYIVNAPRQLASGAPHHLQARLAGVAPEQIRNRWRYVEHHLAHEASAFLAAPFDDCAVLTMDGRGEWATTSAGVFDGEDYRRIRQINLPHSLGLLYEDVTRWLGFLHSCDEYKVMALASYGQPRFIDRFRELIRVGDEGVYTVRRPDLTALLGPPRPRGSEMREEHYDVACSLQKALEEAVLQLAGWLQRSCGATKLAMAGGVALNCVMNARLRDEGPFDEVWVQPAAGDAGTALGAALWTDWTERARETPRRRWRMTHAYLGPEYEEEEIEALLRWARLPYQRPDDLARASAELLAQDRIIGWFQGRMEFGPRALGARSILASPIAPDMQQRLNELKDREDFRPVAPAVTREDAADWFQARGSPPHARQVSGFPAPFMLFVFDVVPAVADRIPAVRHVDGTARVQTVDRDSHPLYHSVLTAFGRLTGVPVLVNTSFNTRGKPIVCTPRDALETFWTSPLDALAIGPFLVEKPAGAGV